jgi:hypothetical protein
MHVLNPDRELPLGRVAGMTSDRVELHRRLAEAHWDAYANCVESGRVDMGDEWVYAADAVMMCPRLNNGEDSPMAEMVTEDMAPLLVNVAPEDRISYEMRMWWKVMPDFRLVSPFECMAEEWGYATRDTYSGTTADGQVVTIHEWDYIWTNDEGRIKRWDWFVDSGEWDPFVKLVGLEPKGLTFQAYIANYLRKGAD